MASSEKPIAVVPRQTARPDMQEAGLHDPSTAPPRSDSPAPLLDRLVGELESAFGAALGDGAAAPASSRPTFLGDDRPAAGDAEGRTPRREAMESRDHSGKDTFEAVLEGKAWAVSSPEDEADAEAPGRPTGPVEQPEAVDQCATDGPRSGSILPLRIGRRQLRQLAIACAVLVPLGIGAAALTLVAPGSLPTAVDSEDVAESGGRSAILGGQMADERGRVTLDDGAEREAQLAKVHEPVTPRLVKTVSIRGEPDRTEAVDLAEAIDQQPAGTRAEGEASGGRWSERERAAAAPAERLQADPREPAETEEVVSGSDRDATAADRWPSPIHIEGDQQPGETAAADEVDESDVADNPAETDVEPAAGTAAAPDSLAAEAEASSGSAADQPAEPTRYAATTADVNMRAGPTNKAAVITVVPAERRIGILGCDSWCEVVLEGKRGWIHSSFLTGSGASRSSAASSDLRIVPGMPLIGSDGARIGIVRDQSTNDAGQVFYRVELAQELGAALPSVWLRKEHFVSADEQAQVRFTRARLLRSLPSQSDADASPGTDAS